MFGISGTELFIIIVFVLLIFGPDKLPAVGRTVGQMMREFKRAQQTMESLIKAEVAAAEKQQKTDVPAKEADEGVADSGVEGGAEGGDGDTAEGAAHEDDEADDVEPSTPEEAGGWTPGASVSPDAPVQVGNDTPDDESSDERKGEEEAL